MSKLLDLIRMQRQEERSSGEPPFIISDRPMTSDELEKVIKDVARSNKKAFYIMSDHAMTEDEWERERCAGC